MNFSIYEIDDNIRELLRLDHFLGDLTIKGFVEELSKDHYLKGAEVNKLEYLDPKPYIRTFESTLRELRRLSDESNRDRARSEKEVEQYELNHSNNILTLASKTQSINKKFDKLDHQILKVTSTVTPLGEKLTRLTNSRDRSNDTIFLIKCYQSFYETGKCKELDILRTSNKNEDKKKCALTIKQLITLSNKISSDDNSKSIKCVETIRKYSEIMERDLLDLFNKQYEQFKFDKMRQISDILVEFNGGSNVIQLFVNQHDFFIDTKKFDDNSILENDTIWNNLSDPDYKEVINDESTLNLLTQIKIDIKSEARIVKEVFSNPVQVLQIFIQRIFAQIIQNRIQMLLQYSLSISQLAYLRFLYSLYLMCGNFTKDLKDFLVQNDLDNDNELGTILDQSYSDLFIEYIGENKYFDKEKKNLEDIIYQTISKFEQHHNLSTKNLTTRLENWDSSHGSSYKRDKAEDRLSSHVEHNRLNQLTSFMKSRLERQNSTNRLSFERQQSPHGTPQPDTDEYSNIKIDKIETILKSAIESLARLVELSPNKIPEHALEVLEILLVEIGKSYIDIGLELSYNSITQDYYKNELDFTYLTIVSLVSEILYLFSSCVQKIILPNAINSPNIKKRINDLTNAYITRCEISLNVILQDTAELISNKIAYSLTKQKKKDFNVQNITEDDTEACEEISYFLAYMYEELSRDLNNENLSNFLSKIGENFLTQLLEHFKKFQVNSTGALILTKDVIRYQSIIEEWKIPQLAEDFLILREVSNLFTVQPDMISSLIKEGQLAELKPTSLRQYILRRADFNASYIERFFNYKS